MPSSGYTVLRAADAPDYTGDAPGAFLGYGRPLGSDVRSLGPRDAVLIPPATPRAARNETDALAAFLMISVSVEDHAAESRGHDRFWP